MPENSPSLYDETKIVIKEALNILAKLKQFDDQDIPFVILDVIESTSAVLTDCSKKINNCHKFLLEVLTLEAYKKESNKTRIMLLLSKYSSEKVLLKRFSSQIVDLGKRFEDCKAYLKRIQVDLIDTKEFICNKCHGSGKILEHSYLRERDSYPRLLVKSKQCDLCEGNGKIDIDAGIIDFLTNFSYQAKTVLKNFENCYITMINYLKKYCRLFSKELDWRLLSFKTDEAHGKMNQMMKNGQNI